MKVCFGFKVRLRHLEGDNLKVMKTIVGEFKDMKLKLEN